MAVPVLTCVFSGVNEKDTGRKSFSPATSNGGGAAVTGVDLAMARFAPIKEDDEETSSKAFESLGV